MLFSLFSLFYYFFFFFGFLRSLFLQESCLHRFLTLFNLLLFISELKLLNFIFFILFFSAVNFLTALRLLVRLFFFVLFMLLLLMIYVPETCCLNTFTEPTKSFVFFNIVSANNVNSVGCWVIFEL
jgi:hypothetical protein